MHAAGTQISEPVACIQSQGNLTQRRPELTIISLRQSLLKTYFNGTSKASKEAKRVCLRSILPVKTGTQQTGPWLSRRSVVQARELTVYAFEVG